MIKKGDKRIINGWAMYDWANSVYPLVISSAIFPIFYSSLGETVEENGVTIKIVDFFGIKMDATSLYSYVLAASFLVISILSPILSGIADYSGKKKFFMKIFCYLGAASCMLMYFFSEEYFELSLVPVWLASIGFAGSLLFYNAYLPEIAEPKDHDSVSAKGFSMGYIGSAILLILNLILIMNHEKLGYNDGGEELSRLSFLGVGVWWIAFAQITFKRLPDSNGVIKSDGKLLTKGFEELIKVWKQLRKTVRLKRYLIAFFVFSMGVQTIMLMATFYGTDVIKMEEADLIITILIIQFVAILGAFIFSKTSNKIGNIKTLGIALVIWVLVCLLAAYVVEDKNGFFGLAAIVGLVMGGTQSMARSTYSKFLPETNDTASFFSFYDVCEKVGVVIGMSLFGLAKQAQGDMRMAILSLGTFFVISLVIMFFIPKEEVVLD